MNICCAKRNKSEKPRLSDSPSEVSSDTSAAWTGKGMGTPLAGEHRSPHPAQPAASLGDTKDQQRGAGAPALV